jgi:hypothetical protein
MFHNRFPTRFEKFNLFIQIKFLKAIFYEKASSIIAHFLNSNQILKETSQTDQTDRLYF